MNFCSILSSAAVLAIVSCENMSGPISSSSFDPLAAPGSMRKTETAETGSSFSQGQFVKAAMDNTAFFKKRPRGDADADKLLKLGTQMKVITTDGAYLKVELDSGDVGFVPSVMVNDPHAPAAGLPGSPTEIQVYPPLNNGAVTPVEQLPPIPPSEVPPEGAIPAVIDPAAPSTGTTPTHTPAPATPPASAPAGEATPPPVVEPAPATGN